MAHAIWKGSLSFGLVNIPVGLYSAESPDELSFSLLDRRDFSHIGYKKINKETGETVEEADIVRSYEISDGQFVPLSDSDFKKANPKATQTVEIFGFVDAGAIPPLYFDKPYYLAPLRQGAKAYSLLREALRSSGRVGLARVVIRSREYVTAVYPHEDTIIVNLLRFAHELRGTGALDIPAQGHVSDKELALAERLIEGMEEEWKPKEYKDDYRNDLLALIKKKAKSGKKSVDEPEEEPDEEPMAEVVDLMSLLKRSMGAKGAKKAAPKKTAPKKKATRKKTA